MNLEEEGPAVALLILRAIHARAVKALGGLGADGKDNFAAVTQSIILFKQYVQSSAHPGWKEITPAVAGAPLLSSFGLKAFRWKNVTWPGIRGISALMTRISHIPEGRTWRDLR